MESNLILSPIPLDDLLSKIREIVREELSSTDRQEQQGKLISPSEAIKLFQPNISRQTLCKWTKSGLIESQKIGSRVFYKYADVIEAGTRLLRFKNRPHHLLKRGVITGPEFAEMVKAGL